MRQRRITKNLEPRVRAATPKEAIDSALGGKPLPAGAYEKPVEEKKPKGFQKGDKNPQYSTGGMSTEIELSAEAFAEMKELEEKLKKEVKRLARERRWDAVRVMQIEGQVARVARLRAILKSNYARMTIDKRYRTRVQEPTTAESIIRYEAQAQKQEDILYRMMGMDEMYEAKLGQVESKSKPAELQVILGGNMSKKHMAAGGGGDGDEG